MPKKKFMLVESPHKAKVIGAFLGAQWTVMPSVGSMFDIENPTTPAEKARFTAHGVEAGTWERNLKCSNSKQLGLIRREIASGAYDEFYVSTDPDRAGAQIGSEVLTALSKELTRHGVAVYRATWNEITKPAVEAGLAARGSLDDLQVAAADARQIYDRLFGYSISPVLWRVIARGASGGRVQSPALRLIVEREVERLRFVSASYSSVEGTFTVGGGTLAAKLLSLGDQRLATGGSFDAQGHLKGSSLVLDAQGWRSLEPRLRGYAYAVEKVETKPYSRRAPAPYTTSSFQQDVGTRLGISAKALMNVAQRLYEEGFITYMRTDSPALSQEGIQAARQEAQRLFGAGATPATPNVFKGKKNAQEGHEALRPTADAQGRFRTPGSLAKRLSALDRSAFKVYECIYNRTVASQMNPAVGTTTTVTLASQGTPAEDTARFTTAATVFSDPGWTALTRPVAGDGEEGGVLDTTPQEGMEATLKALKLSEHRTTPPPRFTEPQLTAKLEDLGIGRPSTYAAIVTVNQTRGYVAKKGQALYPTWTGLKVARYLERKIPSFVSYEATALMEEKLDEIEAGTLARDAFLNAEWAKIQQDVMALEKNISWDEVNEVGTIEVAPGYQVTVKSSGAFLEDLSKPLTEEGYRPGVRLSDQETLGELDFMDPDICRSIVEAAEGRVEARELGVLAEGPYAGYLVTARDGRFGPYLQAVEPGGKKAAKVVNQGLQEGMDLATITLEEAQGHFAEIKLPRTLTPQLFTGIGKRGPWLGRKATPKARRAVFVSLPEGYDPRTITAEEAQAVWDEKQAARNGKTKGKKAPSKGVPSKKKS